MTSQIALDRIQGYLRQLTPQERSRLLLEMERLQRCGEGLDGTDEILQALRTEIRGSGQAAEKRRHIPRASSSRRCSRCWSTGHRSAPTADRFRAARST